uniref:Uncharacterized protein n=1 Tax=Globodera rostochiensis TaxID=31243 RepID=A0A914I502_GLORO
MQKVLPIELIWQIVRSMQFHRRWAKVRVSKAFDQLLLEYMADFLRHAQSLAHKCMSTVGTIRLVIEKLEGGLLGFTTYLSRRSLFAELLAQRLMVQVNHMKLDIGSLSLPNPPLPMPYHVEVILTKVEQMVHRFVHFEGTTVVHLGRLARSLENYEKMAHFRVLRTYSNQLQQDYLFDE